MARAWWLHLLDTSHQYAPQGWRTQNVRDDWMCRHITRHRCRDCRIICRWRLICFNSFRFYFLSLTYRSRFPKDPVGREASLQKARLAARGWLSATLRRDAISRVIESSATLHERSHRTYAEFLSQFFFKRYYTYKNCQWLDFWIPQLAWAHIKWISF